MGGDGDDGIAGICVYLLGVLNTLRCEMFWWTRPWWKYIYIYIARHRISLDDSDACFLRDYGLYHYS